MTVYRIVIKHIAYKIHLQIHRITSMMTCHVIYTLLLECCHLHHTFTNSSNGMVDIESKVPDTITSWVGEAFALHPQSGLGLSSRVELVVRKSFFISLRLPYSVNWNEILTVTPQIFNFGLKTTQV